MDDYVIRSLAPDDEPQLWEMLYLAIYVPPGQEPPPREILDEPTIAHYVAGWGRAGDMGYGAFVPDSEEMLGAAWLRRWSGGDRGYGYVDDATPELSIALRPTHRGLGLGSKLLSALIAVAGQSPISLSVTLGNSAQRLYERFGFQVVEEQAGSLVMVRPGR